MAGSTQDFHSSLVPVAGVSHSAVVGGLHRHPFREDSEGGTVIRLRPVGLLPKPRQPPRTGRRNDGITPLGSAALTTVSVVRGSSLATSRSAPLEGSQLFRFDRLRLRGLW